MPRAGQAVPVYFFNPKNSFASLRFYSHEQIASAFALILISYCQNNPVSWEWACGYLAVITDHPTFVVRVYACIDILPGKIFTFSYV
jgi:hypothetical protein